MNEFELIDSVNKILDGEFGASEIGPGDDSALIAGIDKDQLLVSKDLLVEDVHFDFNLSSPADVGWKALAVNHSDICAMGGDVVGYLIGIGVPSTRVDSVVGLYKGMKEYVTSYGGLVYGGDVVRSKDFIISVTAIGKSARPIKRNGARTGDSIWVSGELGLAQVGLEILKDPSSFKNFSDAKRDQAILKHRRPSPQFELAHYLANNIDPTSMIDIRDGLFQDLTHVATNSKKSLRLDIDAVPLEAEDLSMKEKLRLFASGEDFQLAFTAPSDFDPSGLQEKFPDCVRIGSVIDKQDEFIVLSHKSKLTSLNEFFESHGLSGAKLGFKHF